MTPSIKEFAENFQALDTVQMKKIIGGNGYITPLAINKRKPRVG